MAYMILPVPERTPSNWEAFGGGLSKGISSGLETAMNFYLQNQFDAMQKRKAYEEAERLGLITKEPYQEVPVQGGAAQIAPMAGVKMPIQHKYKPAKGTTIKFEGGIPQFGYEMPEPLTQELKRTQIGLNKMILDQFDKEEGENLIFRNATTGEEVPREQALTDIGQGNTNYIISKKEVTKSGVKETKISEPRKLSEDQATFVSAYKETKKDFDTLLELLTPETTAPLGGFARIATRRRYLVPEEHLRKIQAPYTRVLKTFLFGPAGKALTGTEREVLERAAEATGKTPTEWEEDIRSAYNIITDKYNYLTTGKLPSLTQQPIQQPTQTGWTSEKEVRYQELLRKQRGQ